MLFNWDNKRVQMRVIAAWTHILTLLRGAELLRIIVLSQFGLQRLVMASLVALFQMVLLLVIHLRFWERSSSLLYHLSRVHCYFGITFDFDSRTFQADVPYWSQIHFLATWTSFLIDLYHSLTTADLLVFQIQFSHLLFICFQNIDLRYWHFDELKILLIDLLLLFPNDFMNRRVHLLLVRILIHIIIHLFIYIHFRVVPLFLTFI